MQEVTILEHMEKFLQYCEFFRNYSPYTLNGYRSNLGCFLKHSKLRYPSQLNKEIFEQWLMNGRLKRKWSAATFLHKHKYWNVFLAWMVKEEIIEENFVVDIEKPRLEHRIPRTLTKEQARLVLDAAFHRPYAYRFEKYRNRAIVAVMLLAGLRRKKVMQLKLNDVSFETKTLFIQQGKGNKDRMIPMNAKLIQILNEYMRDRRRLKKQNMYFFVSVQNDNQIQEKCIARLFIKLRASTKLDFSPHTLRHAFARLMLEGGCDIYTLSRLMGHSKITTTAIYLSCSNQQMTQAVEMHSLN